MTLTTPDDIARSAAQIAISSGVSPEHLLLQALQAHFPSVSPELQWEFDAWERASDEDMARLDMEEGLAW